jgi:hypothetical protein
VSCPVRFVRPDIYRQCPGLSGLSGQCPTTLEGRAAPGCNGKSLRYVRLRKAARFGCAGLRINGISRPLDTSDPAKTLGGQERKSEINPMDQRPLSHVLHASRCGAKTRTGAPCQRTPVRGRRRCQLHGGLSPGAPRGRRNGNYTNGEWTTEAIEERRWLQSLVQAFANIGLADEHEA